MRSELKIIIYWARRIVGLLAFFIFAKWNCRKIVKLPPNQRLKAIVKFNRKVKKYFGKM